MAARWAAADERPAREERIHAARLVDLAEEDLSVARRRLWDAEAAVVEASADAADADLVVAALAEPAAFVHNVLAHPLLWAWPRLGLWLHQRSSPTRSAG